MEEGLSIASPEVFVCFLIMVRILNMRAPLLTKLNIYNVIDYKYNVVQQISGASSVFSLTETLCLLISNSPFLLPSTLIPGNHRPTLTILDTSYGKSCSICLSTTGFSLSIMSSSLIHAETNLRVSFFLKRYLFIYQLHRILVAVTESCKILVAAPRLFVAHAGSVAPP